MAADRTPAKTDAERRARYLAYHQRYNRTEKGQARKAAHRDAIASAKGEFTTEQDSLNRLAEMCE